MKKTDRRCVIAAASKKVCDAIELVARYETGEFGVILSPKEAQALRDRGWVQCAARRKYARSAGVCVRTTEEGRKIVALLSNS